jgi:putative transposase
VTTHHNRNSIRLRNYDYASSGAYFVTICAAQKLQVFGEILEDAMLLNDFGRIVLEEWNRSFEIRAELSGDAFVVMPNHIHGIVWILEPNQTDVEHASIVTGVGATGRSPLRGNVVPGPAKKSLGAFVAGFKSAVTKRINEARGTPGVPMWQRNYFERIIRSERELEETRGYITNNPITWALDELAVAA